MKARDPSNRIGLALALVATAACTPSGNLTAIRAPVSTPAPATQACADKSVVAATATCPPSRPAAVLEVAPVGPFHIFFDWGKAAISTDAAAVLDNAAAALARTSGGRIAVMGFSDKSGSARSNVAVARRRAEAAQAYLIGRGVAEGAITIGMRGEAVPLIETADGVREAQNRRVTITIEPSPER